MQPNLSVALYLDKEILGLAKSLWFLLVQPQPFTVEETEDQRGKGLDQF